VKAQHEAIGDITSNGGNVKENGELRGDYHPERLRQFFKDCETFRDLLKQVHVVVPVRPEDGMNCVLSRVLSIWYGEGLTWANLNDAMGGFIEVSRANIAKTFRDDPMFAEKRYLLMLDNDMEPPLELPLILARHDAPVVGGVCMGFSQFHGPQALFSLRDHAGKWRFPNMRTTRVMPAKGLIEVGHCGTGAMMIRRDVLEKFTFEPGDVPFYLPEEARMRGCATGHLMIGEDIVFCNQVREKGYPIQVDLEAHVGHRKTTQLLWPKELRSEAMDPTKWILPEDGHMFTDGAID
jgi:hypothetical protein